MCAIGLHYCTASRRGDCRSREFSAFAHSSPPWLDKAPSLPSAGLAASLGHILEERKSYRERGGSRTQLDHGESSPSALVHGAEPPSAPTRASHHFPRATGLPSGS